MKNTYKVDEALILIDALIEKIGYTHKKAKGLLAHELVLVNGKCITKYNYQLRIGDEVVIRSFNNNSVPSNIEIIYEDKNIIVVNKPSNLLTISTDSEKEKTLYHIISDYVKIRNKNARIFIVHRLDKETSGIILFAKNEELKKIYQDNWEQLAKYRGYMAVVTGVLDKKSDIIKLKLKESDNFKVYVSNDGKESITKYELVQNNEKYSLLNIELKTGRKNQIRVTMEYLNHPIVGDSKYSCKDNSLKRLGLHAHKLILTNPITHKDMIFEVKVPKQFYNITK